MLQRFDAETADESETKSECQPVAGGREGMIRERVREMHIS